MNKNIAFLIPSLRNGGAERVLSNMSINLDEKFNQTIIVWDSNNIDYPYNGEIVDIQVFNKDSILENIGVLLKRIKEVKKYKKEKSIDTTISLLEGPNIVNIFSRKKDKVIISVHNFQSKERKGMYGKIFKFLIKHFYNKADYVVAVSSHIKKDLVENFNISEEKVKVIYNPFDIKAIESLMKEDIEDEYKFIFEKPVIINAGRLTEQKGQWHLIKSFYEVKKTNPDCNLVILGQGELEEDLKKLAKELGIEDSVFFLGFQKNPFKFIHNADIFALTSLFEGFPMCLAESMVCKTPIISVDCKSGPREMLYDDADISKCANKVEHATFGVLSCPFNDTTDFSTNINNEEKEFAKGLVELLNDKGLREEYHSKASKRVKDFDVANILKQWESII